MTSPGTISPSNSLLSRLSENDRERMGEALRRLLANGSILGLEPAQSNLYHWCYQNREWLDEFSALLDLKLFWEHQERTVQAVPQSSAFLLKLKLDATLVLLTLWYEFDTAIRDRGEIPPVRLNIKQLKDSLNAKFQPLRKHIPSDTRLGEILSLAQRKNLLRFESKPDFNESGIDVFTTLKRVIPFQNIEEWNKNSERYLASAKELPVEPENGETEISDDDSTQEA
jgi:hypothetical protein